MTYESFIKRTHNLENRVKEIAEQLGLDTTGRYIHLYSLLYLEAQRDQLKKEMNELNMMKE